jgi:hypothetical protein
VNRNPDVCAFGSFDCDEPVGVPSFHTLHGHDSAAGVTAADGDDAGPVPTALVAVTVNVYAVPLVSPDTVTDVAGGLPDTVTGVSAADPAYGVTA